MVILSRRLLGSYRLPPTKYQAPSWLLQYGYHPDRLARWAEYLGLALCFAVWLSILV